MTDIFSEVEEDLQRERLKKLWDRYGLIVIGAAVAVVLAVAAVSISSSLSEKAAEKRTAAIYETIESAATAQPETLVPALEALAEKGPAEFRALALFRLAAAEMSAGRLDRARKAFEEVAALDGVDEDIADLASVRAGWLLSERGSYEEVDAILGEVVERGGALQPAADEVLGYTAFREGKDEVARNHFRLLAEGVSTPDGIRSRANDMLVMIDVRSPEPAEPASTTPSGPAATDTPTPEAPPAQETQETPAQDAPAPSGAGATQ